MHDVRRLYSIGLPVASMLVFLTAAIISPTYYRNHVRKHEVGWQEQGTVLCLAPAVLIGLAILSRPRELKTWWLRGWVAVLTCGALYFAGEECSWGQNYFGWSTPEGWSQINDQHETNLHNTSGLFDHAPRALLSVAAGCCLVSPFVFRRQQREWMARSYAPIWLFPTTAVIPAAALALFSGIPQKFYGQYDKTHEATNWFGEMFLAGRHSEMKEYFLAMFILMYLWSFATRTRSAHRAELERNSSNVRRLAA
jgi:hypothetical protein